MPLAPLGYMDFKREIAFHLHWGDVAGLPQSEKDTLRRLIQNALRKVFFPLDLRDGPNQGRLYEWSWASPLRSLIVRAAVTGTLTAVPTRIAGQLILIGVNASIFDSDLLGHGLSFDSSGQKFVISEVVSGTKVKLAAAQQPGAEDTLLGERRTTTLVGTSFERLVTVVTESSSKSFNVDMVGDKVEFVTGGLDPAVITKVDTSANQVRLNGDVTGGSGAMTLVRRVFGTFPSNSLETGLGRIAGMVSGSTRADMATDADTVTFIDGDGADGGTYTVASRTVAADDTEVLTLTAAIAAADLLEGSNTTVDVNKAFSTDYTLSTVGNESLVSVLADDFFVSDDLAQKLAFLNQHLNTYEILSLVGTQGLAAMVSGDVTGEGRFNAVSVVRGGGTLDATAAKTYDGVSTVLTATAALFDATMVGLVIEFPLPIGGPSRKYVIAEFTSTTAIKVAGDATDEGAPFQKFLVVGPSDLGANDAFTVANTGLDYELPIDFGDLDGPITFSTDGWSNEIQKTSEVNIRRARQRSTGSDRPQLAAVRPRIHDGRFTQRYDMLLWPEPADKHTLQYRQLVILPEISEENPFPPGGAAYGQLYLEACLAEADEKINDRRGLAWTAFQERLAAMIDVDRSAAGAEQLGPGYEEGQTLARVIPAASGVTYIPT